MKITTNQLIEMLQAHKGATPVGLIVSTVVKDIHGEEFTKINKVNGFLGFNYETSVNNALDRSGETKDFQAGKRSWGTHMLRPDGSTVEHLIEHTNKTGQYKQYVQIKVQSTGKPIYLDSMGRVVGKIEQKEKKKSLSENLGVYLRDYSVESIRAINYKGQRIKVA